MMKRVWGICCSGLIVIALSASVRAAEPKLLAVAGTRVSMNPPAGFRSADRYAGFAAIQNAEEATILVAEVPMELALITRKFTADEFKKQGMTLLKPLEKKKFGKTPGVLVHLSQVSEGKTLLKWVAAIGELETTLITATFPQEKEKQYSDSLKNALLSARIPDESLAHAASE